MGYVIFYDGTFQCYYFRMLLLLNAATYHVVANVAIFLNVATFPCCYIFKCCYFASYAHAHLVGVWTW